MVFKLKRQAKRFIPISSKQPGKFWAKFPEYSLRLELVQDSEETLTNVTNICHRKIVIIMLFWVDIYMTSQIEFSTRADYRLLDLRIF